MLVVSPSRHNNLTFAFFLVTECLTEGLKVSLTCRTLVRSDGALMLSMIFGAKRTRLLRSLVIHDVSHSIQKALNWQILASLLNSPTEVLSFLMLLTAKNRRHIRRHTMQASMYMYKNLLATSTRLFSRACITC